MGPKGKNGDYDRLLAQERLILDATEMIVGLLEDQKISRQELARRLGKSKGYVSQLLSGERNMTLRTLSDLGYVLGKRFSIVPSGSAGLTINVDAMRSVFEAFRSANHARWLSAETVTERMRSTESDPITDYHEYSLAA
jgi:transcriptional regulator with XRE-family HTH domain